jgi:hypothetical protein
MGDMPAQHKHKIKEEFCFALSENKCDRMKRWLINYKDIQPTNSALEEFLIKTKKPIRSKAQPRGTLHD